MSRVSGKLHNLCQRIQSAPDAPISEVWNAYSHHYVTITPTEARSQSRGPSTSQSSSRASISPQKQRKTFSPTLQSWTLYLCQTIEEKGSKNEQNGKGGDDSETESEGEANDKEKTNSIDVWYQARFNLNQATTLSKSYNEESWNALELRLRVAWDSGCMDILADESKRRKDGSFSVIKLSFDSNYDDKNRTSPRTNNDTKESNTEIELKELSDKEALGAASKVGSELAQAYNHLKGQTESLKLERDSHRKLLQNNRRHERFREANSSLVNPGRLKRKTEDDEGFEGDDD